MIYAAIDIANYLIDKCSSDNLPISNLQLQKILYYIQKDFLKFTNIPAFNDEIEAWQFGPVVPNVYRHYCGFGAMKIDVTLPSLKIIEVEDRIRINDVIKQKRCLDPWVLVADTHKEGSPWAITYDNGNGLYKIISKKLIEEKG